MSVKHTGMIAAAVAMMAIGIGAGPTTTQPTDGVVEMTEAELPPPPPGAPDTTGVRLDVLFWQELRLKLADASDAPTKEELASLIDRTRWPVPGRPDAILRGYTSEFEAIGNQGRLMYAAELPESQITSVRLSLGDSAAQAKAEALAGDQFVAWLRGVVTGDQAMSPAERSRRLEEVRTELAKVRQMKATLNAMAQSQPRPDWAINNRLQTLRTQRERLETEKAAKEARQEALARAIAMQREATSQERQTDPIADQLQQVLKLREEEVNRLTTMTKRGVASTAELGEAQAKLAEARVKLAERENALGKAGKGEILDRLADEMTMVSVDLTDVRIQLDQVQRNLAQLDPATATTQSLEQVIKDRTVPPAAGTLPPLYAQLEHHERDLVKEKVTLQVEDVQVTSHPKPN